MSPALRSGRAARLRKRVVIRLALLIPILVAVFIVHVSGTTLVIVHIARIVLLAGLALIGGWLRREPDRR